MFDIPGYASYDFYRDSRGGGIKIYVLENIKCKIIEIPVTTCCETLLLSANVPTLGNIRICGIYRPPQNSVPLFIDYLEQVLNENSGHKLFILGDMNINTLVQNNITLMYNDMMHSFSMNNMIQNISTYVKPNSDTNSSTSCLDHICII